MKRPMRPMLFVTAAFAAAMTAPIIGCETAREPPGGAPMPLVNASGQTIGSVRAWQTTGGVSFHIEARGLPHGIPGIHVHRVGRCAPPADLHRFLRNGRPTGASAPLGRGRRQETEDAVRGWAAVSGTRAGAGSLDVERSRGIALKDTDE